MTRRLLLPLTEGQVSALMTLVSETLRCPSKLHAQLHVDVHSGEENTPATLLGALLDGQREARLE